MPHRQTGAEEGGQQGEADKQSERASEPSRVPDWAIQQLAFVPGRYVNSRQRNHKAEWGRADRERGRGSCGWLTATQTGAAIAYKRLRYLWSVSGNNNNRKIKIKQRERDREKITEIKKIIYVSFYISIITSKTRLLNFKCKLITRN